MKCNIVEDLSPFALFEAITYLLLILFHIEQVWSDILNAMLPFARYRIYTTIRKVFGHTILPRLK
ncbi:MAG: hypothetical protein IIV24_01070 [Alistipes sp.]|nr:hypothetical protein [Alistipes sp.]